MANSTTPTIPKPATTPSVPFFTPKANQAQNPSNRRGGVTAEIAFKPSPPNRSNHSNFGGVGLPNLPTIPEKPPGTVPSFQPAANSSAQTGAQNKAQTSTQFTSSPQTVKTPLMALSELIMQHLNGCKNDNPAKQALMIYFESLCNMQNNYKHLITDKRRPLNPAQIDTLFKDYADFVKFIKKHKNIENSENSTADIQVKEIDVLAYLLSPLPELSELYKSSKSFDPSKLNINNIEKIILPVIQKKYNPSKNKNYYLQNLINAVNNIKTNGLDEEESGLFSKLKLMNYIEKLFNNQNAYLQVLVALQAFQAANKENDIDLYLDLAPLVDLDVKIGSALITKGLNIEFDYGGEGETMVGKLNAVLYFDLEKNALVYQCFADNINKADGVESIDLSKVKLTEPLSKEEKRIKQKILDNPSNKKVMTSIEQAKLFLQRLGTQRITNIY